MSEPPDPVFSPEEIRTLSSVLDVIVPPSRDGGLPGAGELGLEANVTDAVRKNPLLRPVLAQGLARLEEQARGRGFASFSTAPHASQTDLVKDLTGEAAQLVPALLFPTYIAYYQHPRVLVALGREARPPFPKGYTMAPFDPSLLDPVRTRKRRLFREC
jgi:hypothetical protein